MEDRRSQGQDGCAGHMLVRMTGGQDGQLSGRSCHRTKETIGVLAGELGRRHSFSMKVCIYRWSFHSTGDTNKSFTTNNRLTRLQKGSSIQTLFYNTEAQRNLYLISDFLAIMPTSCSIPCLAISSTLASERDQDPPVFSLLVDHPRPH